MYNSGMPKNYERNFLVPVDGAFGTGIKWDLHHQVEYPNTRSQCSVT